MHRLIIKPSPKKCCDHINRDKLDHRRKNLRCVSQSINIYNTGLRKNNKSGYKGISWIKERQKWEADLGRKHLGRFTNLLDAVEARRLAEEKYLGI